MIEDIKVHMCDNCGAEMLFDISAQVLKCPFCDNTDDTAPEGFVMERDFSNPAAAEAQSRWQSEVTSITCNSCGAEILTEPSRTAVRCAFCGSDHILQTKQDAGIPPDGIVPFQIDKVNAQEKFLNWVKKRFWAPGKLKTLFQSDKIDPVYLPYWTFDAHASCPYTAEGGKEYYVTVGSGDNKHRERRVRWYHVRGHIRHFFDDVLINAQKTVKKYIAKLEIFNTKAAKPFSDTYLVGFTAEKYTILPQEAYQKANQKMRAQLEEMAKRDVLRHYDEVRFMRIMPSFSGVTFKHLLLPFWITAFMYQDKLYNVAINAQTGQVYGEYPKSKVKIAIAILLGIALLTGILFLLYLNENA